MATTGIYAFIVIAVAFAIIFAINFVGSHYGEMMRKLVIIISFFVILGAATYPRRFN